MSSGEKYDEMEDSTESWREDIWQLKMNNRRGIVKGDLLLFGGMIPLSKMHRMHLPAHTMHKERGNRSVAVHG